MHRGGWMDNIHPLLRERWTDHISYNNTLFFWVIHINASVWREIILGYFAMDIICSEKRMIFEERSFKKAVDFG